MSAVLSGVSRLRFGAFELDLKTGELRKGGTLLDLPPQPFRILALLASHAGELVTRKEIRQQIWGSETFVDFEQGLNFAINKVRGTLGDDAEAPRYIETLPRRGYRFIASVEPVGAGPSLVGQEAPQAGPPQQPTLEERSQKASVTQINAAEPLTSEAVSKQAVLERPSIGVQGMVRFASLARTTVSRNE